MAPEVFVEPAQSEALVVNKHLDLAVSTTVEAVFEDNRIDMSLLETYGINWSAKKIGRDIWQNFFDGNNGTLDGVMVNHEKVEIKDGGLTNRLTIHGDTLYSMHLLRRIGAGTKTVGGKTAGGFGEGAKMLSLCLLRDYEVDRVRFGSGDWILDFMLDETDDEESARGLFGIESSTTMPYNGNFFTIETQDDEAIEHILFSSNYFESSMNPDFQNPTLVVTDGDATLMAKYTGLDEDRRPNRSSLYIAGMRRQYDFLPNEDDWYVHEGLTLAISGKDISHGDRDRGGVQKSLVEAKIIDPLIQKATEKQLVDMLFSQQELWPNSVITSKPLLESWQEKVVDSLFFRGFSAQFSPQYYALDDNRYGNGTLIDELREKGYIACPKYFGNIGMKKLSEIAQESRNHLVLEPTEGEKRQIEILIEVGDMFKFEAKKKSRSAKKLGRLPVFLFDEVEEKRFNLLGEHRRGKVWLSLRTMKRESLADAASTYLHELDHVYGTDNSKEFSYALTDTMRAILEVLAKDGKSLKRLKALSKEWTKLARLSHERESRVDAIMPAQEKMKELGYEVDEEDVTIVKKRGKFLRRFGRNTVALLAKVSDSSQDK